MNARYLYFEGLRGILAVIVVIHHFVLLFFPEFFFGSYNLDDFKSHPYSLNILVANTPLNIFMNGDWAVCMFFTLSGFVLSLNYFKTNEPLVLQEAIGKRYFRLIIPILAACIFVFILHVSGIFKNTFYPRAQEIYSFGKNLFLNDVSFFEMLKMALFKVPINGDNTYLPILWTMELEFLGAILLFAFLLSTHRLKNKWLFYLVLFFVFIIMNKNYVLLFFAGSFIALYEEKIKTIFKNKVLHILILLFAIYFSGIPKIQNDAKAYTIYGITNYFPPVIYMRFHLLSCILFFLFIVSSDVLKKLLTNRLPEFFGKISFAMYLIHLPLLFIIGSFLLNKTNASINPALLFVICFLAILPLSYCFYYLFDLKAVQFANKFVKRFIKPE